MEPIHISNLEADIQYLVNSLPGHTSRSYKFRDIKTINKIILHHSGSQLDTIYSAAKYHVTHHHWPGIGYHFVIDRLGKICQTQNLDTISYHCKGQNSHSIGICLLGNFMVHKPGLDQLSSLGVLLSDLDRLYPDITIEEHRTYGATLCPGTHMSKELAQAHMRQHRAK